MFCNDRIGVRNKAWREHLIIPFVGIVFVRHGSNVAGLETTATFDPASDQFIIHTPTITATKWWIGGAAHSATHAFVHSHLVHPHSQFCIRSTRGQWKRLWGEAVCGAAEGPCNIHFEAGC